jgi:hypothetical protein
MNVANTLKLNDWVQDNEEFLRSPQRGTLVELAEGAAKKLGFKVNASNLAACMKVHDIPTRKQSDHDAERLSLLACNEQQAAEIKTLRRIVAKVMASNYIPEDLREYILADLPREMKDALSVA